MRTFDFSSPLLRSVDAAIRASGGMSQPATRKSGVENLTAFWFPDLKHGTLCYDSEKNLWDQTVPNEQGEENLALEFTSNGDFWVREGDDVGAYLETTMKAGDEIKEFLEFFSTTDCELIGKSSSNPKPLSTFFEEVFVLIPGSFESEDAPRLLPLRGQAFSKDQPIVAEMLDAWLRDDPEAITRLGFWHFGAWLDDKNLRDSLGTCEDLRIGDLILSGDGKVHYTGMLLADAESDLGFAPSLALRPKANVSRMWLIDYLEHAAEADGLVQRICSGWQHLPKGFTRMQVNIPTTKRDQIADSICRRSARSNYLQKMEASMRLREPFEQIAQLFQKRTRAAEGLHTELLDDLEAMQHPLPFFIEYPYRVFRRESDPLRKIKASWRLLGILAKVPLYLVLEELLNQDHPLGDDILKQLEEKPPSDGTLQNLHKDTAKALRQLQASPLHVFSDLVDVLENNTGLGAIVTKRNRLNHEPFDEQGFLKIIEEEAPVIVDSLRSALSGCKFLIPLRLKFERGKKTVTAENVCNADVLFRQIDLETELALEDFPTDELIAYRSNPEKTVKLGRLLTTRPIFQESHDFGVFDRVDKEAERKFIYLRSQLDAEDPFTET